jgi:hypothetical protein
MGVHQWLVAGVLTRLVGLRGRIGAFFTETPLFFIAVVLGIAVLFRAGIGLIRPEEEEAESSISAPSHPEPRTANATTSLPSAQPAQPEVPSPAANAGIGIGMKSHEGPPRRRPRTHGRR